MPQINGAKNLIFLLLDVVLIYNHQQPLVGLKHVNGKKRTIKGTELGVGLITGCNPPIILNFTPCKT
jgi:hypothetical protein